MPGPRTAGRVPQEAISFWGWFESPELEARFRQHYLHFDKWQAALSFSVGLLLGLAFIPADIQILGHGDSFRLLLVYRLFFAAVSVVCLLLLRRDLQPKNLDLLALCWVLLAALLMFNVGATRFSFYFLGYAFTEILGLGLLFVVVPLPLPYQVAIGGMVAVVDMLVQLPRHSDINPVVRGTVMAGYLIMVAMGSAVSWSMRRFKRQEFAALEREAALRIGLESALAEIKTLHGILPICRHCKKVRDDDGYWQQVEVYVKDRTDAEFAQGVCPECVEQFSPYRPEDERKMERVYSCSGCAKPFRVESQIRGQIAAPEPEVPFQVPCPLCGAPQAITWPEGRRFLLAPAQNAAAN